MWTIESEQKWNYYSYQYLIFFYKYIHCVLYCTVSNDHYLFCFFNFCEFFFFFVGQFQVTYHYENEFQYY